MDVLVAARERITYVFAHFPRVLVGFSGGKDSTVLLHLAAAEARRAGRKFGVLFIDWEAQFERTIDHIARCLEMHADVISERHWVALPLKTTNACSMHEPEWICFERGREADWVRQPPEGAITAYEALPFYTYAMTFEEFVPAFCQWYAGDDLTASLVGLRTGESLNRWRTITGDHNRYIDPETQQRLPWTVWHGGPVFNAYPLYDWHAEDIWTFHGRHPDMPHNSLYDLMHQAGLSIHQMRICEPYGDEQRRGLWLYHILEPETWGKVVARVAGANSAAEHAGEWGNILGNGKVTLPPGHTWQSFAQLLLGTMPAPTAEHYRNKISVWLRWWQTKGGYSTAEIHDSLAGDTGAEDMPSWRRVCKVLLRNDYWCYGLCFSATKSEAYERYRKLMRRRRDAWKLSV